SEPLWHGIDPSHRLHGLASAAPAAAALEAVYRAIDRLVGRLVEAFPAAEIAVFAMHGMGPNDADVACMLLLPELLFRHAFGLPRRYGAVRDEIVELLQACRDPLSGEAVVERVHFPAGEPARLGPSEADISVIWRRAPLGLAHPRHGRIGPVPFRRTGGHTGD